MINKLKRTIITWARKNQVNMLSSEPDHAQQTTRVCDDIGARENRMNFTIHFANGGYVIEYTQYDKSSGEYTHKLYVITEDQKLSEKLESIICIEALRR